MFLHRDLDLENVTQVQTMAAFFTSDEKRALSFAMYIMNDELDNCQWEDMERKAEADCSRNRVLVPATARQRETLSA